MAHTFYFGNVSKRKNSTLQGVVNTPYDVLFKSPTSLLNPVVTLNHSGDFTHNYATYGSNYYFVTDRISKNNDLWEVHLKLDALATYKSDILASTQFVSYSSHNSSNWLVDTRIPILKNASVSKNTAYTGVLSKIGCYILSAVGMAACNTYMVNTHYTLDSIMQMIDSWTQQDENDLMSGTQFDTIEHSLEAAGLIMSRCSLMGNAYEAAPQCIRSCIWVPFDYARAPAEGSGNIWLGRYDTQKSATKISGTPVSDTVTINIPWHFSDWRRAVCEQIYLYLPLVGMVALSSDSLTQSSSITIDWSVTYTDGCITYEVKAGNQIIGTYGAQCSANYPLGLTQQASAGQIVNTVFGAADKTISAAINSSLSPISAAAVAVEGVMSGTQAMYDVTNQLLTFNPSCVGGIGGGAGAGLDLTIACYTVAHDTAISPSNMAATMGLPTMQPMSLATLTGYCQCANAHVSAMADLSVLNEIDSYLNEGFYIE